MTAKMPDLPRLIYVVPDGWYDAAIEAFRDLPVEIVKQSDTLLPPTLQV